MAETAAQKKKREAAEALAAESTTATLPAVVNNVPAFDFKVEKADEETGEIMYVDKYKYIEGYPRAYRCDAKTGTFEILDGKKLAGNTFTFQPIAWRFFQDDIMKLGLKTWAELFFIDEKGVVSVILFHSATAENLERLATPLYYDDISLMDTIITVEMKEHTNTKIKPAAKYWIGEFSYTEADPESVKEMKAYVKTVKVFRRSTLQDTAIVKAQKNFYNPFEQAEDTLAIDENS